MKRTTNKRSPRTGRLGHEAWVPSARLGSAIGRTLIAALVAVVIALTVALPSPASAAPDPDPKSEAPVPHEYAPGVVLVRYAPSAAPSDRIAAQKSVPTVNVQRISAPAANIDKIRIQPGTKVEDAVRTLARQPGVLYAEPDYIVRTAAVANDPYLTDGSLWGMAGGQSSPTNQYGSHAVDAWGAGVTGSRDVVVGIVDEGIDINHPDLAANIWTNPFDPLDGLDNDGNGYIDDINGWDFHGDNNTVYDGEGGDSHGTHVAGTVAGVGGNGEGVAGVSWNTTLIPAKFLGPDGGNTSDAIAALDYLTDLSIRHGVNVVASNNSWGGGDFSRGLKDAIERGGRAGILFVAAAGNWASDTDAAPVYPAGYECIAGGFDCVISVAAINSSGERAGFSNYGARTVDLGAPGEEIVSTVPGNQYAYFSGTSMAAPHVTGAIALCAAFDPATTARDRKSAVLRSATATPSLAGITVTGARLDANAMTSRCHTATAPVDGTPHGLTATTNGVNRVQLAWQDRSSNEDGFDVETAPSNRGICGAFADTRYANADSAGTTIDQLDGGSSYCFRVRATNGYSGGSVTPWSNVATATTDRTYECTATQYDWIDPTISGTQHPVADDDEVTVAMPFDVTLYEAGVSSLQISANGFARFDGGSATSFANVAIPSVGDPNGILAPLWDDLNPEQSGGLWTTTVGAAPNRRFVVGWIAVPHFGGTGTVSVELVVDERTNAVTFQYQDVDFGDSQFDGGASATVGMEDPTGQIGTQVSYNTASVANGTSQRCVLPSDHEDLPIELSIGNATLIEGNRETRRVRVPVTLSEPARAPVTLTYRTVGGSATAGSDFVARRGEITIPRGSTSSYVQITISGDTRRESNERFSVKLEPAVGVTLGRATGAVRIHDDDNVRGLRIAAGTTSVVEGHTGQRTLHIAVTVSAPARRDLTVQYRTADGTAVAGRDYRAASGTLHFPAGTTTRFVTVKVHGDRTVERSEHFALVLSGRTGASIVADGGRATIVNDD